MGSKVLLADDSITIQKVVGIIFANEGYDLTTVATGDDAVKKAVEVTPDVMLVDALMPGKNGYEVCREVRQNPALRHVAILLMTGAFEVVDEEKNRTSGADEFITKPFESQALIDATNRMIALTAKRAAAPAPPETVLSPVPPAPPAPPSVDDVWATGFDMEPAAEIKPVTAFESSPTVQPVETVVPVNVTSDDDLWGAFDMEPDEITPLPVQVPAPVVAADDFFSFEAEPPKPVELPAEDEFILDEIAIEPAIPETVPTVTGFEPVGEQEISFFDVAPEPVTAQEIQSAPISYEEDFSSISFDEPVAPVAAPIAPSQPPVIEMAPLAAPLPQPIPEPVITAPAATTAALDEDQLRVLLSSVSRDVIERIVWEIVPDLAETIIKEEIRKLKAGIA